MDADGASTYIINRAFEVLGLPKMCYTAAVGFRDREVTFYLRSGSPKLTQAQQAQLRHIIGAKSLKATAAWIVGQW